MKKTKQTATVTPAPITNITYPLPLPRDYRRELWLGVAIGLAAAFNSSNPESPGKWADTVLKAYDKTFGDFHI